MHQKDFFDQIHEQFRKSPQLMALVPLALAVMMIWGAVQNWDWLYAPNGTFRGLGGVSGYIGRGTARVLGVIIACIFLVAAFLMYQSGSW